MVSLLTLFFLIFLLIVLLVVLFILFLKISSLTLTGAPYIQIPDEVLPHIVNALELRPDSRLYDLGCGNGKVLMACQKSSPRAEYIGVDNALFPVFMARRLVRRAGLAGSIKIVKQDFFETDISSATHIFLYLYPELVNKLLPKFEKELKSGARVVACDYCFTNKKPLKIVNLHRPAGSLGKFLYVYGF